jgi:hypothetical protein
MREVSLRDLVAELLGGLHALVQGWLYTCQRPARVDRFDHADQGDDGAQVALLGGETDEGQTRMLRPTSETWSAGSRLVSQRTSSRAAEPAST